MSLIVKVTNTTSTAFVGVNGNSIAYFDPATVAPSTGLVIGNGIANVIVNGTSTVVPTGVTVQIGTLAKNGSFNGFDV